MKQAFFTFFLCGCFSLTAKDSLSQKSINYLLSQQNEDGSWKSQHFGVLKQGQALTPFVLFSLLDSPEFNPKKHQPQIEKALDYIHSNLNSHHMLGLSSPHIWEYPNYATAYALRCFLRSHRPFDQDKSSDLAKALIKNQYDESEGFSIKDIVYGGWGFGGWRKHKDPGHMDLAHTRVVLVALQEANIDLKQVSKKAGVFLKHMQNKDGGFHFSPNISIANKGVNTARNFGSYSSATCDGILSLRSLSSSTFETPLKLAFHWLNQFPSLSYPQGISPEHPSNWGEAMFYYHLSIKSEVFKTSNQASHWPQKAIELLANRQSQDGSFQNPNSLLKESDPLIATSLALQTLSHLPIQFTNMSTSVSGSYE